MNSAVLRQTFVFVLFVSGFFLLVLYMNEAKSFVTTSYIPRHLKSILSNGSFADLENLTSQSDENTTPLVPTNHSKLTEHWTYECTKDRCIRQFYHDKTKQQVTFLSCSMVCGNLKVWPNPTKANFKRTIENFKLSGIQYQISTQFKNVAAKLEQVMTIFHDDLKKILSSTGSEFNQLSETEDYSSFLIKIRLEVTQSDKTVLLLESDECYKLSIVAAEDHLDVNITGNSFFGVRHGIETLKQLIWYDDAIKFFRILSSVNIEDCPMFRYRGIMLDTSRHYFSVETIKRIITGMSLVKLNRFHWHMTDSQSFPFVSQRYPDLSIYGAYSSKEVYTHDDVKEIVEFATVRGIQIITEIDAPAHAGNGWQWGPEKGLGDLSLCINQQPWKAYCGEPSCGQLNPKNNNTYEILEALYEELINLTQTTDYFHLGGDEVNLDCWRQYFSNENLNDLWCKFMTEVHERLKKANSNKKIQHATVWNSDWSKMKCLSPENFTIQVWLAQPQQMKQLINNKYNIIISHVDAWYFDCGFGSWRDTKGTGTCPPFKAWYTVYNYRPWDTMKLNDVEKKQILGGEACMWTEQVNENSVDTRIWPRATAFAERMWTDPKNSVIPKETVNRFSVFQRRFLSLGLKSDAIFPKYCEQNEEECI